MHMYIVDYVHVIISCMLTRDLVLYICTFSVLCTRYLSRKYKTSGEARLKLQYSWLG